MTEKTIYVVRPDEAEDKAFVNKKDAIAYAHDISVNLAKEYYKKDYITKEDAEIILHNSEEYYWDIIDIQEMKLY